MNKAFLQTRLTDMCLRCEIRYVVYTYIFDMYVSYAKLILNNTYIEAMFGICANGFL